MRISFPPSWSCTPEMYQHGPEMRTCFHDFDFNIWNKRKSSFKIVTILTPDLGNGGVRVRNPCWFQEKWMWVSIWKQKWKTSWNWRNRQYVRTRKRRKHASVLREHFALVLALVQETLQNVQSAGWLKSKSFSNGWYIGNWKEKRKENWRSEK